MKKGKKRQCAKWEQWAGLVDRRRPDTLILTRLKTGVTKPNAPGPGAIKKVDWRPFSSKFIQGRKVVLFTDSARSYKTKINGVIHHSVSHKKKRVYNLTKKKYVWKNPSWTKIVKTKLPNGEVQTMKAGTQIIDRCWQLLKKKVKCRLSSPGYLKSARSIRSAQWFYWNRRILI